MKLNCMDKGKEAIVIILKRYVAHITKEMGRNKREMTDIKGKKSKRI